MVITAEQIIKAIAKKDTCIESKIPNIKILSKCCNAHINIIINPKLFSLSFGEICIILFEKKSFFF